MNELFLLTWVCIYFAHLVTRYWLPRKWFVGRDGTRVLLSLITPALIAWLISGAWTDYRLPLATAVGGLVELLMLHGARKERSISQLWAEAVWIVLALIFAVLIQPVNSYWVPLFGMGFYGVVLLLAGWSVSAFPVGILIGVILQRYPTSQMRGFTDGGKTIGSLERSIILLLFLINAPVGVGFLITAKTLFRFGEISRTDDQKNVEYILIGTLLSFLLGMLVALLTVWGADFFFAETSFKLLG